MPLEADGERRSRVVRRSCSLRRVLAWIREEHLAWLIGDELIRHSVTHGGDLWFTGHLSIHVDCADSASAIHCNVGVQVLRRIRSKFLLDCLARKKRDAQLSAWNTE